MDLWGKSNAVTKNVFINMGFFIDDPMVDGYNDIGVKTVGNQVLRPQMTLPAGKKNGT